MSTKREPLLSDQQIIEEQEAWDGSIDGGEIAKKHQTYTARWVRDTYEAARAKDAELIQRLVDAGNAMSDAISWHITEHVGENSIPYRTEADMNKAAKAWDEFVSGFTPSK